MKPYPKYKESGVEWIGTIPENWERSIIKRYILEHKQGFYSNENYVSDGTKLLRITDIDDNANVCFNNCPYVKISEYEKNNFSLKVGDFLFARSGTIGRFGVINFNEDAIFASYLIRFRFSKLIFINFLKYYFFSSFFRSYLSADLHGGANKNIHAENIKDQIIILPPISEQKQIASFLDKKTTQIDELINKKKQMIELLKEERTSIINQAVTKGIKSNIKMKNSGVEWIGDIPEHWELKKLKYLLINNKGALKTGPFGSQLKNSELDKNGTVAVYNQRNVLDDNYIEIKDFINEKKYTALKDFEIFPGDILITSRGTIGYSSIFPNNSKKGVLHPCLIRIQLNEKILKSWFIIYTNFTTFFKHNIFLNSNSTTIEVIYGYTLREILIPIPPKSEQKEILSSIEKETKRIDIIISKCEKEIELLQEYRIALISEAVTGKIDVREEVV